MAMPTLKFYKTHLNVNIPKFATKGSACFDLSYDGSGKHSYSGFTNMSKAFTRNTPDGRLFINTGERVMVPTGLIMDIPSGFSVRLHARSGMSYKQGLILANSEAVIDSDYVEEVFVLIYNRSNIGVWLSNGDRVAQGELVRVEKYNISETTEKPTQKTDRVGGMGSTGV